MEFSAELIVQRARSATGLSDFGDSRLWDGFERTIRGLSQLPLTDAGHAAMAETLVDSLGNRLKIEDWWKNHPDLEAQVIEGPVLVCGLPRTGTTATVAMLVRDPRFRFLRRWESASPVPPPVLAEEQADPRRLAATQDGPQLPASMNLFEQDGTTEDLFAVAGLDMRSLLASLPMPDEYLDAWLADTFDSTYAVHARLLKLLQSRRPPNRWLLKAPAHIFKLEAFARQYPAAKFIMTHRDPAKVIPSVASLYYTLYNHWCPPGTVDKHWTGRRALSFWSEGVRRAMAARDRIGQDRFVDVRNDDVVKDPIATFERLYSSLGWVLDADFRRDLEAYHKKNARGSHGEHNYSCEEYGLTETMVRDAFADYITEFRL